MWIAIAVAFNLTGMSQDAPMEMKASMTAGLLLVIYGIVWMAQKAWSKLRMNEQETL
ncbi:hypothetical protein ACFLUU_06390 [Chloroflexota bacterium]